MKIYTRTGDRGQTGLFGGPRVAKDEARVEAYGTIDELNAALGMIRAEPLPAGIDGVIERIQNELFDVGAELASPDPAARSTPTIGAAHVAALEADIDRFEAELMPLRQFLLPGGTRPAAGLHVARAVCRRAERRLVTAMRESNPPISPTILAYLNRLGDLLFVVARAANAMSGKADVPWRRG
jgi:cob(I)alamin adenosyltransferase